MSFNPEFCFSGFFSATVKITPASIVALLVNENLQSCNFYVEFFFEGIQIDQLFSLPYLIDHKS